MIVDIKAAQADMRSGYCSGGAGILASSMAWFAAAFVAVQMTPRQGVWALFIGGMLIHPVAVVLCKLLGASGAHRKDNPLGGLAGASTVWLIVCLPLAYAVALLRIEWFFPAMLLVIGGRYMVFSTLYGMSLYWVLGAVLVAAGCLFGWLMVPPAVSAFAGAGIELLFAIVVLVMHRRHVLPTGAAATARD